MFGDKIKIFLNNQFVTNGLKLLFECGFLNIFMLKLFDTNLLSFDFQSLCNYFLKHSTTFVNNFTKGFAKQLGKYFGVLFSLILCFFFERAYNLIKCVIIYLFKVLIYLIKYLYFLLRSNLSFNIFNFRKLIW